MNTGNGVQMFLNRKGAENMNSLEKALEKAKKCKFYFSSGGVDSQTIRRTEQILGFKFSKLMVQYYEKCEYLSFDGNEFKGINPDKPNGETATNSVSFTISERKNNLPMEWFPFYEYGDGYIACFDFNKVDLDGEPPVIMAYYDGNKYIAIRKIANNIGDFILGFIDNNI